MGNLQRYDNNGIELLIDLETGESFASISGYARMAEKSKSTISERVGVRDSSLKEAQIETAKGLQSVRLLDEDYIVENLPKDNPKLASKMLKVGVRIYLHGLAGFRYEVKKEEPQVSLTELKQAMDEAIDKKMLPFLYQQQKLTETCEENKGVGYILSCNMVQKNYPDFAMTTAEYCKAKGLDRSLWNTFARRYGQFVRVGTGENPPRKGTKTIIVGKLYYYAQSALINTFSL